jgi:hypothetical protein
LWVCKTTINTLASNKIWWLTGGRHGLQLIMTTMIAMTVMVTMDPTTIALTTTKRWNSNNSACWLRY